MEKLLKEFTINGKHGSEQELSLWRNYVMPVKNRSRRFRYVADLDKRLEFQEQKAKIREKSQANLMLYMEALKSTDGLAGDDQGVHVLAEMARETKELPKKIQNEFLNEAPTAGCGIGSSQLASALVAFSCVYVFYV